ncbi:hypothetical protein RB195_015980 [Necator americanus]|uniref:Uncharacterized protein n=1 Tax=Necator americanus TaxID=51031 RepID=A0ABR1E7B0_NECAM
MLWKLLEGDRAINNNPSMEQLQKLVDAAPKNAENIPEPQLGARPRKTFSIRQRRRGNFWTAWTRRRCPTLPTGSDFALPDLTRLSLLAPSPEPTSGTFQRFLKNVLKNVLNGFLSSVVASLPLKEGY